MSFVFVQTEFDDDHFDDSLEDYCEEYHLETEKEPLNDRGEFTEDFILWIRKDFV